MCNDVIDSRNTTQLYFYLTNWVTFWEFIFHKSICVSFKGHRRGIHEDNPFVIGIGVPYK